MQLCNAPCGVSGCKAGVGWLGTGMMALAWRRFKSSVWMVIAIIFGIGSKNILKRFPEIEEKLGVSSSLSCCL